MVCLAQASVLRRDPTALAEMSLLQMRGDSDPRGSGELSCGANGGVGLFSVVGDVSKVRLLGSTEEQRRFQRVTVAGTSKQNGGSMQVGPRV